MFQTRTTLSGDSPLPRAVEHNWSGHPQDNAGDLNRTYFSFFSNGNKNILNVHMHTRMSLPVQLSRTGPFRLASPFVAVASHLKMLLLSALPILDAFRMS